MVDTVDITPTRCIFNGGQFDSDFRYVRRTSTGVRSTMLAGPALNPRLNTANWIISWRWRCGSYNVSGTGRISSTVLWDPPGNPDNTPSNIAL